MRRDQSVGVWHTCDQSSISISTDACASPQVVLVVQCLLQAFMVMHLIRTFLLNYGIFVGGLLIAFTYLPTHLMTFFLTPKVTLTSTSIPPTTGCSSLLTAHCLVLSV